MIDSVALFLGGDVMTGRGVDQIMPHPSKPRIHESYVRNAREYVNLAIKANGPIQMPVSYEYIWGEALPVLNWKQPDGRIINLETSITISEEFWKGKEIHYRMHPDNIPCLTAAGIDCCALANNHVLDWGYPGLTETLFSLEKSGIKTAGAGSDIAEASAPAVMDVEGGKRILIFSFGLASSGISHKWVAMPDEPGVNMLPDVSNISVHAIKNEIQRFKHEGDIVVFSVHWGSNWGYKVLDKHRRFARELVDIAGVDIIHGHSSHHFKEIEVYRDKLILYGCGDLINDYEGIRGHESYRDDLGFMYFPEIDAKSGGLVKLSLLPTQIKRIQLTKPLDADMEWMMKTLERECATIEFTTNQLNGNIFFEWENKDLIRSDI